MSHTVGTPASVIRVRISLFARAVMKAAFVAVSLVCLAASIFFAGVDASKRATASLEAMTLQALALRTPGYVGGEPVRILEAGR